mmetsp:Transcript_5183/g.4320  ORF Transcript_5183/g.4320 Transcript_5183/m.4320 type:complete len:114 (+) Transcript_5183:482-823(+)
MSPERAAGEDYTYSADIWSLGVVAFELLTGINPFSASRGFIVLYDSLCHQPAPHLDKSKFPKHVCSFVEGALTRNPLQRPTATDLISHDWISPIAWVGRERRCRELSDWLLHM